VPTFWKQKEETKIKMFFFWRVRNETLQKCAFSRNAERVI